MTEQDAGRQPPARDRTREFERPQSEVPRTEAVTPPEPLPHRDTDPPPASLSSWIARASNEVAAALPSAIDAAPLVLGVVVGILVLRRRRWRMLLTRAVLCLAAASVAGLAVFYGTYLLGCRAMTCVDAAGIVPILAGLGTGAFAGIAALVVLWRFTARRASD